MPRPMPEGEPVTSAVVPASEGELMTFLSGIGCIIDPARFIPCAVPAARKSLALHHLQARAGRKLVHDDALHRVDGGPPRRTLDHAQRVAYTGLPAGGGARRGEVGGLPKVLAIEPRRRGAR